MRVWILGNLAAFLLLISSGFAAEMEWLEVRSPHFSVVTDAGEKRGREVALRFEQMRAVFGTLMAKAKVNLPVPLQIVAFRTTPEMQAYAPLWNGKPTQAAGLFEGDDDRSFILIDLGVGDPWQVVFHEYAHQLLNGNSSAQFQPWFEEGFAEYFSSIRITGKEAEVGLEPRRDYQFLQQGSWVKVADLFRVQQDSSTYNENGDQRTTFYAESWLVVHYLFDKRLTSQLDSYFKLTMEKHLPVEEAIQRAFGMSAADFDLALEHYDKANRFASYKLPAPAGMEGNDYTANPLGQIEVKTVLADMDLHSRDFRDRAKGEFEDVLKLEPDNVAALRGLGYSYFLEHDFARAGEYFNRAVQHDPENPRLLYYSALMIEQQDGPGVGNDVQELLVIQKRLEKAVELDPEFADAYCRLAFTYVSQGEPGKALRTMAKAAALNPRSQAYALNLAEIYLFNGRVAGALDLLEPLQPDIEPRFAAQATQLLERARAAQQAIAAGKTVAAQPVSGDKPEPARPVSAVQDSQDSPHATSSTRFLKGRLIAVDCSASPEAVLTVVSGPTTWKLHARDSTRVITIGAENLSCDWSNRMVAVNYEQTGEGTGEIISLELQ